MVSLTTLASGAKCVQRWTRPATLPQFSIPRFGELPRGHSPFVTSVSTGLSKQYTPSTTPSFCCGSCAGNRGFPCPGASSLRELKRRNESGIQIDVSKEPISVLSLGIIAPAVGTFIRSDSACRIEIER